MWFVVAFLATSKPELVGYWPLFHSNAITFIFSYFKKNIIFIYIYIYYIFIRLADLLMILLFHSLLNSCAKVIFFRFLFLIWLLFNVVFVKMTCIFIFFQLLCVGGSSVAQMESSLPPISQYNMTTMPTALGSSQHLTRTRWTLQTCIKHSHMSSYNAYVL